MCKIIADAGSSKTDWALTDTTGAEIKRFSTPGLNALLSSESDAEASLRGVLAHIPEGHKVGAVHYYGAGCATPDINRKMQGVISRVLNAAEISVESDLLGAARSLLGRGSGIACILGTGSNSCLYDGNKITANIPSLGYILGDEGSGAAIGKRLIADALKGKLPEDVSGKLLKEYNLDRAGVLERVYRMEAPNKFLASLAPFACANLSNSAIRSLVSDEFRKFLNRNVLPYTDSRQLPVSLTGSVAYHFKDILSEIGSAMGLDIRRVEAHPLSGLVEFHK